MSKTKQVFWLTGKGLVVFCAIAFASYLLFVEHSHHLVGWLPYLIILLCPLMHLFMHGGHGHHQHHSQGDTQNETAEKSDDFKIGYLAAMRAKDKQMEQKTTEDRDSHERD